MCDREAAMFPWKRFLCLMLLVSGAASAGCSSKAALPEKKASSAMQPAKQPVKQPERVAKAVPRELAFSTYSKPEYGVAFRYPRNFALEEGAPEDLPGVRSQEELGEEQPGAVLVATVVVPDDAYPNTTFAGGSLQFAVNPYLTAEGCRGDLISRLGDSREPSGAVTVHGVVFAWAESEAGDASAEYFERNYSGFSNGACYEFFARAGVSSDTAQDGVRPADAKRILGHLEKIVSSLEIEPKDVSVLDQKAAAEGNRGKP
jgi:hypothetical protein